MCGIDPTAFIHPHALVDEGVQIGARTRVWAFAHIVKGAIIGADCNICDHTFIEGNVNIGARVTLKCGVYLWNGITVEDDVFIGPNATFTNDLRPRSRQHLFEHPRTQLRRGCSIGANATVLPGITLGLWSMAAAGSVITRDVPDHALVVGSPAKFRCWLCKCGERLDFDGGIMARCQCGLTCQETTNNQIELVQ
jgi:UDP-2-acetamido-3-amino-2,3-dideoxy-glucuronate N-acetyltransferase